MIIQARQARTANTCAPLHTRRSVGTAAIRGLFAPSIRWWLHPNGSPAATGTAVAFANDFSANNTPITQATASKQPLKSATSNVPGFTFDGVNDCLQTSPTNVDLSSTGQITIAWVTYTTNNSMGMVTEFSTARNAQTNAMALPANGFGPGTIGLDERVSASGYQAVYFNFSKSVWLSTVATWDRALAGSLELNYWRNGAKITSFVNPQYRDDSTGNFGSYPFFIGSTNNGASNPYGGAIAMLVFLTTALSDDQALNLSILCRQAAGTP